MMRPNSLDLSLHHRRLSPTDCKPAGIPWLAFLDNKHRERAINEIDVTDTEPSVYVCRMTNPDIRVTRSLAALFNPILYPGVGQVLRITQQELAYLVGLSRQRVNEALTNLSDQGTINVEYGGLRVLDLYALRTRNF